MFNKTQKIIDYLTTNNLQFFDVQSDSDADILKHNENINGITLQTAIVINDSASIDVVYMFAQCKSIEKKEDLILLMNELNCNRQLKYCLREEGLVTAAFHFYADDNDFKAENLISLYVLFIKSFKDNNDISRIMKLIWG